MDDNFKIALFVGLLFLLLFWTITLIFIYFRKPLNLKHSSKRVIQSLTLFLIGFLLLVFISLTDSI